MTVKGIEVAGTIYDNEDETARTTATEADSTARTASQTATQASETATTASQTATTASQTATQADAKATTNATAISELQSDVEALDSEVLKKSDLTSTVTQGSTAPITSGGVFSANVDKVSFLQGSGSSLSDAFDNAKIAKTPTDIYGVCGHIVNSLIKGSGAANNTVTLHNYSAGGPAFAIILQKQNTDYGSALIFNYATDSIYEFRYTGGDKFHIKRFN